MRAPHRGSNRIIALLMGLIPGLWMVLLAGPLPADVILDPGLAKTHLAKARHRNAPPGLADDTALLKQGMVRCRIQLAAPLADPESAQTWLSERIPNALWEGSWGRWAQVVCPIDDIEQLMGFPDAEIIARPPSPFPQSQSQGVEILKAPAYWNKGFNGEDVSVAVVDVGFYGYTYMLGTELPKNVKVRSFYHTQGGGVDISGDHQDHGLLVAEIIHDIAPGAELLLTNFGTLTELGQAVDWAIAEGAQIINHSVGWFDGPRDGTGEIASIAQAALDQGVIWINSAGNYGEGHWNGSYLDQNRNGFLELDDIDSETIALGSYRTGRVVSLLLWWSRWPESSDLHLDLQLWEGMDFIVSSYAEYGFYPYAIRGLAWVADHDTDLLTLKIYRGDDELEPVSDLHIELFRLDGQPFPEGNDPAGSLIIPADVPGVIAVGAVDWQTGALERYSSWGPTLSGLKKPEILSSANVATSGGAFSGTSASSPHVAGAAALLQAAAPRGGMSRIIWTLDDIRRLFQRAAEPIVLNENAVDWGVAVLPLTPEDLAENEQSFEVHPNPSRDGSVTLKWMEGFQPPEELKGALALYDVTGRLIWTSRGPVPLTGHPISFRNSHGALPAAGTYWLKLTAPGLRSATRIVLLRD
ncbi:MAG: S8 family serine peptidase [Candidatus Eisenbacteria bacterium]|uniref:S8 family serine peptidase n=1 Tax=Eiseniibacteriota bacterium TaxID=2212470 RepID=A0A948RYK5_UNCEI|nr:S8 family serine peptidase [Candidatus Eisenbacteria bacterium]MBU1947418.1 S8 family serine peptidase [Candidatus Eisenbacteria bacterium]MBU2693393.1 S8 family serine peptidase [Candidatus Eisenbacteria bacterium]